MQPTPQAADVRRLSICLTFDVDAVALQTATFRSTSPSDISRGEFGPNVAIPRILELLASHEIRATFFVPAITARQFPATVRALVDDGHEVGAHGDLHERVVRMEAQEEALVHSRSIETLTEIAGDRPYGFRAPGWELSLNTIELLERLNFVYDSSQMATEYLPYRARRGDRVTGPQWSPGEESAVVEMPVSWELDDFPPFYIKPPAFLPSRTIEEIERAWMQEFDWAYSNVPDGVFTLTMHPEIIGRGPRLDMLDRLIGRMRNHESVAFLALIDAARAFQSPDMRSTTSSSS